MELQSSPPGPEGLPDGHPTGPGDGMSSEDCWPAGEPFAEDLFEPGLSEDDYWSSLSDDQWLLPEWDADGEVVGPASVSDRFADALAELGRVADRLVGLATDPDLVLAGRDLLIGWTRSLEQVGNKLRSPGQALINLMEAAGCRIDGPLGLFCSPQAFLVALLGIPAGEAKARVRAARLLAPSFEMDGRRTGARYRVLAAAQASGELSAGRVESVTRALTKWQKLLDLEGNNVTAETLVVAEEVLARQARVFDGRDLDRVIERVEAYLCPDGMVDDRPAQDAVRSFEVRPVGRGLHKGMYRTEGWLTAETGAKLTAVLDPLSKPQPVTDETGHLIEPDRRDRGARVHDALEEVLDRSLRAGDLPAHGVLRPR